MVFFLCFVEVFSKLLAKGLANKTIHDIMHAVLGEERFFCAFGEN
jgi:hypothetical protein